MAEKYGKGLIFNRNSIGSPRKICKDMSLIRSMIFFLIFSALIGLLYTYPVEAGVNQWSIVLSDVGEVGALAVDPSNSSIIYAGISGTLRKSTDGGSNWNIIGSGNVFVASLAINSLNPNNVYVGTQNGLFVTTNGGTNWSPDVLPITADDLNIYSLAADPANSGTAYAGTWSRLVKTINGGSTWSNCGLPVVGSDIASIAIDPSNSNNVYVGTSSGVFKTLTGGNSWSLMNNGLPIAGSDISLAIDRSSPGTVYAGTPSGVFKTINGGSDWSGTQLIVAGSDLNVSSVVIDSAHSGTVYAGTANGVYKTTNGGGNWNLINNGFISHVISALAIDSTGTKLFAGTTDGNVYALTVASPPGAPTGALATAGNAQATISFTPPTSDGGTPITSYTVTSSPEGITATGSASPITVTGLTNGTAYTFTVTATNGAGTGPASTPSNSVTPVAPVALTSLTIQGATSVYEQTSSTYTALASYSDGTSKSVTPIWFVNSTYATISSSGVLSAGSVTADQAITINASYTENAVTKATDFNVTIVHVLTTGSVHGKLHTGSPTGPALSGATVVCGSQTTTTATDGTYSLSNVPAGDMTLSFSKSGYQSASKTVTIAAGNDTDAGDDYLTQAIYVISGTITAGRFPLSGVTVNLSGDSTETFTTGIAGTYVFSKPNGNYTITPSRNLFTFQPSTRSFQVNGRDVTGQDFSGALQPASVTISLPGASSTTPNVNAYRMVGIPVIPNNPDLFTTLSTFWNGQYNPQAWRLFRPDYSEITGSGQDSIDYGKGWWIVSSAPKQITITGSPQPSEFQGPVVSGYQIISCPFAQLNVLWSNVCSDSSNSSLLLGSTIYTWDGSGEYIKSSTMIPGQSYWVYSKNAGTLRILNPVLSAVMQPSSAVGMSSATTSSRGTPSQPPPPLSPAASIRITSPASGLVLKAGQYLSMHWQSLGISPQGFNSRVRIEYSTNHGKTYSIIAKEAKTTGSLQWRVPKVSSKQCLIKITSVLYPQLTAVSNEFTIK